MALEKSSIKIALIGQPNVGKSTVFNMLTGLDQHVGNWPGKTVEFKEGSLQFDEAFIKLVDLPGTYGLTANSEEERIARNFIIHEQPDLVMVIVNAASLERNLYLVTELLALDVPLVMGLNMMDVADQQGFRIDVDLLETALGFPIVPIIASKNVGLKSLVKAAVALDQNPGDFSPHRPEIPPEHEQVYEEIFSLLGEKFNSHYLKSWIAIKLLEGDREVLENVQKEDPEAWERIREILIENEEAILTMLECAFRSHGYSPTCTTEGQEALSIMKRDHVRVFFLDLRMPTMDGMELCKRIKREDPEARVYAISAFVYAYSPEQFEEAGFDGYFRKPFDIQELLTACDEAFTELDGSDENNRAQ